MDDNLRRLMQDLGNAINESLSDSDRIAEAIGEIKRAGYDVFLVLEATIGFNKRDEEPEPETRVEFHEPPPGPPRTIKWTPSDRRFLDALKIRPSDELT
ncbi:MAG: hypothetical protein M1275_02910 [Patescibacteria group bacterium]|nr:hypothetical protein [Patescibacteria group bacterium]